MLGPADRRISQGVVWLPEALHLKALLKLFLEWLITEGARRDMGGRVDENRGRRTESPHHSSGLWQAMVDASRADSVLT